MFIDGLTQYLIAFLPHVAVFFTRDQLKMEYYMRRNGIRILFSFKLNVFLFFLLDICFVCTKIKSFSCCFLRVCIVYTALYGFVPFIIFGSDDIVVFSNQFRVVLRMSRFFGNVNKLEWLFPIKFSQSVRHFNHLMATTILVVSEFNVTTYDNDRQRPYYAFMGLPIRMRTMTDISQNIVALFYVEKEYGTRFTT